MITFEGRLEIVKEIQDTEGDLKDYLVAEISALLSQPFLISILEAHVSDRHNLLIKTDMIIQKLQSATANTPTI